MVVFNSFDLSLEDDLALLHIRVPTPAHERERVKILRQAKIVDSNAHDIEFDRLTVMCARVFKVPLVWLSFVDITRVWIKSSVGIPEQESPRDQSVCSQFILDSAPSLIVVPDATKDVRLVNTALVTGPLGIKFVAAVPILCQGMRMGVLCIADASTRDLGDTQRGMLTDFAELMSAMVEDRRARTIVQEEELAKLIVGVNAHLKGPLRNLSRMAASLTDDVRAIKGFYAANPEHPALKIIVPESMRTIDKFYLQVEQFHEQVEIALLAATAYDRAKRNLQDFMPLYHKAARHGTALDKSNSRNSSQSSNPSSSSSSSSGNSIPHYDFVRGRDLVDALQQSGCLSQHLAGHVEWELCRVLQHGDVRVDVGRLGIVLASTMTLGAHGCERMKVNCSVEGAGTHDFVFAEHDRTEKLGRLMVNLTMSRQRAEDSKKKMAKPSGHIGANTFVFAGMTASPESVPDAAVAQSDMDTDVVEACNEVICSTILRAEHGDYRQQKTAVMDTEILLVSCWLPCRYRVSAEHEDACPQDWRLQAGRKTLSHTGFSVMAVIEEAEEVESDEEDRRTAAPRARPVARHTTKQRSDRDRDRAQEDDEDTHPSSSGPSLRRVYSESDADPIGLVAGDLAPAPLRVKTGSPSSQGSLAPSSPSVSPTSPSSPLQRLLALFGVVPAWPPLRLRLRKAPQVFPSQP